MEAHEKGEKTMLTREGKEVIAIVIVGITVMGYIGLSMIPHRNQDTIVLGVHPGPVETELTSDIDPMDEYVEAIDRKIYERLPIGDYRGPGEEPGYALIVDHWMPNPGTPCALFGPDWYKYFEPTKVNFIKWFQSVEFGEEGRLVDPTYLAELYDTTPSAKETFGLLRQHQALRQFIVGYQKEVFDAYIDFKEVTPLTIRLEPIRAYLEKHYSWDEELWANIGVYDLSVTDRMREAGTNAEYIDDDTAFDLVDYFDKNKPKKIDELTKLLETWTNENN